jgi:hypothetical protein
MEYITDGEDIPVDPQKNPPGRPKGSHKPKMTRIERANFIKESIQKILGEHFSHTEYVNWCRDNKDISRNQANEYWLSAWNTIRKKFDLDKNKLVLKHVHKYWEIHSEALEQRDLTNARQALNDLAKLMGLNEPDKVEVRGTQIKLNFGNPDGNND